MNRYQEHEQRKNFWKTMKNTFFHLLAFIGFYWLLLAFIGFHWPKEFALKIETCFLNKVILNLLLFFPSSFL